MPTGIVQIENKLWDYLQVGNIVQISRTVWLGIYGFLFKLTTSMFGCYKINWKPSYSYPLEIGSHVKFWDFLDIFLKSTYICGNVFRIIYRHAKNSSKIWQVFQEHSISWVLVYICKKYHCFAFQPALLLTCVRWMSVLYSRFLFESDSYGNVC